MLDSICKSPVAAGTQAGRCHYRSSTPSHTRSSKSRDAHVSENPVTVVRGVCVWGVIANSLVVGRRSCQGGIWRRQKYIPAACRPGSHHCSSLSRCKGAQGADNHNSVNDSKRSCFGKKEMV